MREDLEDAYGTVDWAKAQFPAIQKEIEAWFSAPAYLLVEEPHPETGKKIWSCPDEWCKSCG